MNGAYLDVVEAQERAFWACREARLPINDIEIGLILRAAAPAIRADERKKIIELYARWHESNEPIGFDEFIEREFGDG